MVESTFVVGKASPKGKINKLPKSARILSVSLIFICLFVLGVLIFSHSKTSKISQARQETNLANESLAQGNKVQALDHAKKALAEQPNNINNIQLVANITGYNDPSAAKQYYAQALSKFIQQSNLGSASTLAGSYYFAASLALQAGETSQAKQYFQEVVKTAANSSNSYQQSIVKQSQAYLEGSK